LYPLKNDEEVGKYFNKTIKKLQIYDIKHDTNLVDTLEAYFGYNLNNKLTASKLFIHIETLRYRLNRIEEITGFSPNETEGIFALQMGLKLMKLIGLK
jgi:purine catabolism regulator